MGLHPFTRKNKVKAERISPDKQCAKYEDICPRITSGTIERTPWKCSQVLPAMDAAGRGPDFSGKFAVGRLACLDFVFQFGEKSVNFCVNRSLCCEKLSVLQHI
jgi:hypothetical protein